MEAMETSLVSSRAQARLRRVEEHVRLENLHDLDGLMSTFGETGFYDDAAWGEHHGGLAAVRRYYEDLLRAARDFHIEVQRSHTSEEVVVLEVTVTMAVALLVESAWLVATTW